jgi:hypothetical protein
MATRSSQLSHFTEACPLAYARARRGDPIDRDVFHCGTATHLFLESYGHHVSKTGSLPAEARGAIDNAVGQQLMARGRSFDGVPEPPLPPKAVLEGKALAHAWVERYPLEASARYEIGIAVDWGWNLTRYDDPAAMVKGIIDVVEFVEEDFDEEGGGGRGARIIDYKTSWQAGASSLDNVQQKIQLCLVDVAFREMDLDFIQVCIANVRKLTTYRADPIWLDEDGKAQIQEAREDIRLLCRAAQVAEQNPVARPGKGCFQCDYTKSCDEGAQHATRVHGLGDKADLDDVGEAFAFADALRADLVALARQACSHGSIALENGDRVGFEKVEIKRPVDGVEETLWATWVHENASSFEAELSAVESVVVSFLKASKMGVKQVKSLVNKTFGTARGKRREAVMDKRVALEIQTLETTTVSKFGVWRSDGS